LVVDGRIGDVHNYQYFRALFTIYCAKEKDFDQVFFKKEMKELGFHRFLSHKVFEIWGNSLPNDITEDEVKGQWKTNLSLPESEMILTQS